MHETFTIKIEYENTSQANEGVVRVFMAPKFDERGQPWSFTEQRLMMIEIDNFSTVCKFLSSNHS
jgi:Hemocyanin, ig-like domain